MPVAKKKTSFGLVSLMLLSLFSALLVAPSATAIEQVDLAIVSGPSPVEVERNHCVFCLVSVSIIVPPREPSNTIGPCADARYPGTTSLAAPSYSAI